MTSTTFFFVFIPILAILLLAINLLFAPHNPYQEKNSTFECGFHSFLGQNRTQFSVSFFIFALLFLLFDLEILLVYPYVVSAYTNGIYGLVVMLIFFLALTLGFAFELGKNALKIDSRQMFILYNNNTSLVSHVSGLKANISKHFTFINFIVGLISLIIFGSIKHLGLAGIILNFFCIENTEFTQYIVAGFIGLIAKLGVKGLVEEYFKDFLFNCCDIKSLFLLEVLIFIPIMLIMVKKGTI